MEKFNVENLKAGDEVVTKRSKQGRFQHYGYEYTHVQVSRVTKARIFVMWPNMGEREFNKSDLQERSTAYDKLELVADPAEIQKIRDEQAARTARAELNGRGYKAFAAVQSFFDVQQGHRRMENRSQAQIELLEKFAADLKALEDSK